MLKGVSLEILLLTVAALAALLMSPYLEYPISIKICLDGSGCVTAWPPVGINTEQCVESTDG